MSIVVQILKLKHFLLCICCIIIINLKQYYPHSIYKKLYLNVANSNSNLRTHPANFLKTSFFLSPQKVKWTWIFLKTKVSYSTPILTYKLTNSKFITTENEWISFVNKFGCTFKQHELAQFLQGIVNGRITVNILTRMYQAEPDKEKAIKNVQQKIQLLLSPIAFHQDKDLSKGVADTITTAFVNGIIITSSELGKLLFL